MSVYNIVEKLYIYLYTFSGLNIAAVLEAKKRTDILNGNLDKYSHSGNTGCAGRDKLQGMSGSP